MSEYNPSYQSYSSGTYSNNPSQGYSYGAGGFMASGEGSTLRRDSEGRSSDRSAKTVRSVTIRQLLNCDTSHSDSEQILDGKPLNIVTLVAKVHSISPKNNLIDITVEDGSGFIEVKLFSNNNNDNLSEDPDRVMNVPSEIKINEYIRASGTLKEYKSHKSFIAYAVRPITDHNEISYHLIEVVHTHLSLIRGGNNRTSQGSIQSTSTATGSVYDSSRVNNSSNTGTFTSKLHKEVVDLVSRNAANDVGMRIDDICRALAFQYGSDVNVRNAIDDLVSEGQLYNTSDDNHVQVTGAVM